MPDPSRGPARRRIGHVCFPMRQMPHPGKTWARSVYELFLDSDQQYSCAYFETPEASLEDAQLAKKRHLAAKLALEPGQTVLDIGSGWGGLGLYIARHSNAYVQGVTLSEEQLAVSRSRAEKEGLRHKVQFDLQDYRSLETRFDRIVSVGMFEHVGRKSYDEFFSKVHDLLADDGVALLHYIGRTTRPFQTNEWILKYIFPGGYMPSEGVLANMVVGEDFAAISTAGFSRRDLLDRAVVIDRVASDGSAFAARRDAAETFWSAGMPCNREVSRVLDGLLVPVSVEQAVAAAVEITTGYGSFQARPQIEHPVQSALIGQALARVYENGFAFVSVPAGAGLTEIQDELQRRMANNAARMIGNGAPPHGCWDAHVETATGGNWPEDRISSILGSQAPLALDGSIAPIGNETLLRAAHRRMSCRYRMRGAPGSSDFSGFPEIRRDIIELPATKGQLASYTRVIEGKTSGTL